MSLVQSQIAQIVQVLCASKQGVLATGILAALQANYPDVGWDINLLLERLNFGLRKGSFTKVRDVVTGEVGWMNNPKMTRLNPYNNVFVLACSRVAQPLGQPAGGTSCGCGVSNLNA